MLKAKHRWLTKEYDQQSVLELAHRLKKDPLLIALCYLRGLQSPEEIERFLEPENQSLYDPYLLKGMKEAVERIELAISRSEKILIYGDYDADGVMSTTIIYYLLQQLGVKFNYHIPNRFHEGYGLNKAAIEKAAQEGYQLIITVDTGISAYEEVEYANTIDLDVIITDHHEPPDLLPRAYTVINPKQSDCSYPYPYLCGAGVALKLTQALLGDIPDTFYAYAAIGTIADLVPLRDENRSIVIRGLQALRATKQIGLKALLKSSGIDTNLLDAGHVGFAIGPRINAAGRLDHADIAVQLLTTTDLFEAEQLADKLNQLNMERQEIVKQISLEAELQAEQLQREGYDHALVVAGVGWHEGVVGIVASRLVERYYRPTIVLSIDPNTGVAKGSARSIDGFDLYHNLTMCKDLLLKYGGHTMAAGLSIKQDLISSLRSMLQQLGKEQLSSEQLRPKMDIELNCTISDITLPFVEQLSRLAPFGVDNPEPKILIRDMHILSQRKVGTNGEHIKWVFHQEDAKIDAIAFRFSHIDRQISGQVPLHVVAEVGINEWNGIRKPQLIVSDVAIDQLQIFDNRGTGKRTQLLKEMVPLQDLHILYFRPENDELLQPFAQDSRVQLLSISKIRETNAVNINVDSITDLVIFDAPTSYQELQYLCAFTKVERIWLLFGDELNQQRMTKLPDREVFKSFYHYFYTNKSLALDNKIWEIVKWKRISEVEIRFMIQVFLELGFIYEQDV